MKYGKREGQTEGRPGCGATGCPCTPVSNGGDGWLCRFHDQQPTEKWRGITAGLREHAEMIGFMDELQGRYAKGEDERCREMIARLVEAQPDMRPGERQGRHIPFYLYRLTGELAFRVGASKRRPAVL